jgi:hypothetical protein
MLWIIWLDFEWAYCKYPRWWNWCITLALSRPEAEVLAMRWFERVRGYPYSEATGKLWCGLKVKKLI